MHNPAFYIPLIWKLNPHTRAFRLTSSFSKTMTNLVQPPGTFDMSSPRGKQPWILEGEGEPVGQKYKLGKSGIFSGRNNIWDDWKRATLNCIDYISQWVKWRKDWWLRIFLEGSWRSEQFLLGRVEKTDLRQAELLGERVGYKGDR